MRREWLDPTIEKAFDGDAGHGIGSFLADYLIAEATITTDAQLDALPVGSIVRHDDDECTVLPDGSWQRGAIAEKRVAAGGSEAWFLIGRELGYKSHQADLVPALLLYMGGPL